jgi:peptidoglycan hydrolase CwlO-like protein
MKKILFVIIATLAISHSAKAEMTVISTTTVTADHLIRKTFNIVDLKSQIKDLKAQKTKQQASLANLQSIIDSLQAIVDQAKSLGVDPK